MSKYSSIGFRVSAERKAEIEAAAEAAGVSMSEWIKQAVQKALDGSTEGLADAIATDLLTNGSGEKAHRLALRGLVNGTPHEKDLGGWSAQALKGRIAKKLREVASA